MTEDKDYDAIIKRALGRNPFNPFTLSCQRFLETRGYLTEKQVKYIKMVTRPRRFNNESDDDPGYWSGFSGNLNGDY